MSVSVTPASQPPSSQPPAPPKADQKASVWQSIKQSLPTWQQVRVIAAVAGFLAILGAWVWLFSSPDVAATVKDAWIRAGVLTIVAIPVVGVFLLTYFAYRNNQEPIQKDRVKDDFFFLGLADEGDLEQVVDKLFQNVYNPGQFLTFAILISLVTLAMGMAYLIHSDSALGAFAMGAERVPFINATGSTEEVNMIFAAFLGAYLFSIQELVRRYNTFDLLPQVYSSIFVRMIVATGVVGVGAAIINVNAGSAALAYVIAFLIGSFPQRGIDWMWAKSSDVFLARQRASTTRPLDTIIGISSWHEARLLEMGIDDAQNLATVDIRKLLLTTQFDTQAIVNWIDQSILYVKVGEKIDALRGIQLLTFTELHNAINDAMVVTFEDDNVANSVNDTKKAFVAGLLRLLGLADEGELLRLRDASNYPNFYHISEYYDRSIDAVQRRADAGSKAIFNADLPLLAMHFELDSSEGSQSEDELQKKIYTLDQRLSRKSKDSRLLQTMGTYKQQLAKQQAKRLAEMPSGATATAEQLEARTKLQEQLVKTNNEAKEAFDKAVRYGSQDPIAYIRRAAFRLSSDNEGAIEDCSRALMLDPGLAAAYNYRGIAHYQRNYKDLALEDFSRALTIDDRMADAYLNRGTLYNSNFEFAAAQTDLQNAYLCTRNNPGPTLLALWGKALYGLDQWPLAIAKLTEAIILDSKSPLPYVDRGWAYFKDGKFSEAQNDSLNAIRLDPTIYFAHETLGKTYLMQNRYRDAIGPFEKASELAPDADAANRSRLSLGYAHLRLGEYQDAVGIYERILKENPSFGEARMQLALAYQGANDPTQAKAHLQYLIDHNPKGSPIAEQAQFRLNEGVGQPSLTVRPMPTGNGPGNDPTNGNGAHQPGANGVPVTTVNVAPTPANGQAGNP